MVGGLSSRVEGGGGRARGRRRRRSRRGLFKTVLSGSVPELSLSTRRRLATRDFLVNARVHPIQLQYRTHHPTPLCSSSSTIFALEPLLSSHHRKPPSLDLLSASLCCILRTRLARPAARDRIDNSLRSSTVYLVVAPQVSNSTSDLNLPPTPFCHSIQLSYTPSHPVGGVLYADSSAPCD